MVAASQKLLSLVGVANLATRAASSRPYRCGGNRGRESESHVECNIPCCLARWPCTPESPLPIGFAGFHPGFLVRHPSKSPFTPISQIAEGWLFEIWEYYLIFRRGWVGGWLLSTYGAAVFWEGSGGLLSAYLFFLFQLLIGIIKKAALTQDE